MPRFCQTLKKIRKYKVHHFMGTRDICTTNHEYISYLRFIYSAAVFGYYSAGAQQQEGVAQ